MRSGDHVRIGTMLALLRRPMVRTLTVLLILLGLAALAVAPAFAHSELVASSPANGESLAQAPAQVRLTFSNKVLGDFTEVSVLGADRRPVETARPVSTGNVVTQALPTQLPKGTYVVSYRVVSADSHPISGQVRFTVTVGATPSPTPSATSSASPLATASQAAIPPGSDDSAASTAAASTAEEGTGADWPLWLAVGAGVVLLGGALVVLRRRGTPGR